MIGMVVLTVLALPLVLLVLRGGRRRWSRRCEPPVELALFHHGVRSTPSRPHRLTPS
ncbi:hypothetical protein [Saccharothrix coeruleofusca]|uniref:Uncharacterized protein n=1 Tax=Saccharothrix coeruleofusca TaxID=33919 RepID=A0A918EAN3_9PSEU|nr:hypothetical protein [Saccharothrix coeruleofusca]MBP2340346.1 hypothetical protein [Saccharothrix coeruleofusca]GGP35940.1 hypothetical protein GCM10010185_03660 [Saccharothrix coeruleofusca]